MNFPEFAIPGDFFATKLYFFLFISLTLFFMADQYLGARGESESLESYRMNVRRIFSLFRNSTAERKALYVSDKVESLPLDTVITTPIYVDFAEYLEKEYVIESGKYIGQHLGYSSVLGYLGCLLQLTSHFFKYRGGAEDARTKLFFTCLDGKATTDSWRWLKGLKKNLGRRLFERAKAEGEVMDKSATPLYVEHLRAMAQALAREGSPESALRKLALTCCHQSAGRSSEIAWTTWRGIEWDPHFKCCFIEVPCSKPGRFKIVALAAGRDRHVCFFTALGDYLALNLLPVYEEEEAAWFMERLQASKSPGATVSGYIADLRPDSGSKKYKDFLVHTLPPKATAAGWRPGACNALAARMPEYLAGQATDHEFTKCSAFFEYTDPHLALCMPASRVLCDWPPFPYGQLGLGSVPASLQPVLDSGVDEDLVHASIDRLFTLHSASPPQLLRNGSLRDMVNASAASLIMAYSERLRAGEMLPLLERMRSVTGGFGACTVAACSGSGSGSGSSSNGASTVLIHWGTLIAKDFTAANSSMITGYRYV